MMKGAAVSFPDSPCWSKLYAEALFETDRSRLRERIAEAEKAIVARAGELFNTTTDNIEEVQTIEDALYVLMSYGHSKLAWESRLPLPDLKVCRFWRPGTSR